MTVTHTTDFTFTLTHARYLASKVAADLRQMQRFYGRPTDEEIDNYIEELSVLLLGRYVASIEYGFRRNNKRIVVLEYKVRTDAMLTIDDHAGRVPPAADIAGASWYSYLVTNQSWHSLSPIQQAQIQQKLPFQRAVTESPQDGNGTWTGDKTYSTRGEVMQRRSFQPL